ncbi:LPXTG cell wall anchor domain-containing protein [Saccharothrix deserti]|uniref:LPXTG cell wall anchor domain-containing protein n=1 Tax=Saccharothrix deserti TaxID=2593674 RepID=UPI00131BF921|nr:LPXTG cell wall anchor domain-containing protein [Saccharothrix deserti]
MQFARVVRASFCVAAAVATASLLTASPASAHIPTIKAECVGDEARLAVSLSRYDGRRSNWLKVDDNGEAIANHEFRESYSKTYRRPGTARHVFTVTVFAWDDAYPYAYPQHPYAYPYGGYQYGSPYGYPPGGYAPRGWSFTKKFTVEPCVVPPTTTTTVPATTKPPKPSKPEKTTTTPVPVTTTPVTTTTTVETTTTTTTTPLTFDWPTTRPKAVVIPAANDSELPDTGADVTAPLVLGVLLLTGGVIVLVLLRRRIQG